MVQGEERPKPSMAADKAVGFITALQNFFGGKVVDRRYVATVFVYWRSRISRC